MKYFFDTENGNAYTETELQTEFEELQRQQPEEYSYSFKEYLQNCTDKNGFLEEVTNAE